MKKFFALVLVAIMTLALVACNTKPAEGKDSTSDSTTAPQDTAKVTEEDTTAPDSESADSESTEKTVMSYAEFDAAELDSTVVVETYIQGKQSWWENKGTFYTQAPDGAYFLYNMACTEEEYNKLTVGTKIRVEGVKAEWAGEVEIVDAKFTILESDPFIAEAKDVTEYLGKDELASFQNQVVKFTELTVKSVEYKNGEPGDDIYVTFTKGDVECSFCVEAYLTGPDTDLYKKVGELKAGDVVNVTGFLYWYEGANTHITAID